MARRSSCCIWAKVIKGMDVVEKIGHVDTDYMDKPIEDVVINKITIEENN